MAKHREFMNIAGMNEGERALRVFGCCSNAGRVAKETSKLGAIHLSFDSFYESWYCFTRVFGSRKTRALAGGVFAMARANRRDVLADQEV
jgi:hypothetical protein